MESHEDLKSLYVKLVDNLNCAICQDVLKDARDLTCGHTYCLSCLQELVAIKGWTRTIQCCLCKKETAIPSSGLAGLKQNYKLNCILDEQVEIIRKMTAIAATVPVAAEPEEEQVQVFVRDLEGKSQAIMIRPSDTVDALKREVEKKTGIPPNVQRLVYQSKPLEPGTVLSEYNVRLHSTIELVIPLKGGLSGN